ncbi:hypothetical protein [Brevibacillus migulae]|uniref:hypothetical protein n=1 Tax=Brevibacillus migulae TaxID=1644114 RepID=UPI00106E9E35|nr:hypothetical protein [Brevibacillus migulae]
MTVQMIYYLAWQEDDWLDEILDFFPQVNAVVPTAKVLEQIKARHEQGEADKLLFVVNVADEQEKSKEFLQSLQKDEKLSKMPLYLVGVDAAEEESWKQAFPQANVIVIRVHPFEFDYEAVFRQMKSEWEGA